MRAARYAVDTNVLLRLSHPDHPQHELIATALRRLVARDFELCFTPQNLGEFWNVSTRPLERNGLGLSIDETDAYIRSIERRMTVLQEDRHTCFSWRRILLSHKVRGVQVRASGRGASIVRVRACEGLGRSPRLVSTGPMALSLGRFRPHETG